MQKLLNHWLSPRNIMTTNKINEYLCKAYIDLGFKPLVLNNAILPNDMNLCGGIEKKNFNMHRAVGVLEYSGEIESFTNAVRELKLILHKELKARFWKGLGIGLFFLTPQIILNSILLETVYSAKKSSTSLIQWVVNVSPKNTSANIAHTYTPVRTSLMIDEVLDHINIPIDDRNFLVAKKTSIFKTKL